MLGRYWIVGLAWLVAVGAGADQEVATARVVGLEEADDELIVVLNAGQSHGLTADTEVTLLRQAEPIVHPLTGEVLGVPQEPVGVAQVFAFDERQARGRMIRSYSEPEVGDLAEYERPTDRLEERQIVTGPAGEEVEQMMERMKGLEQDLSRYRKAQKEMSAYPVFAQQVWDELRSIKSYLIGLDERLVELESLQGEDRNRLNAVVRGEYRAEEMREFTIRYSPDTDIRLQVAGKTLVISVERDSLRVEQVGGEDPFLEEIAAEEEPDDGEGGLDLSLLSSPYVQAGSLGIVVLLAGTLYFLMKRREDSFMDELEDLDDDDDDEEDEEDY